jgi:Mg-chelatase subunit ChlD
MADAEIRRRWEQAIAESTDQRALNVARNVQSKELREKLEQAADVAVEKAVAEATREDDVHVMFLIDKSGSMQGAIEQSKEALTKILAGFSPDKVHIASFDTLGTVLVPKAPTRAGVQHMLERMRAEGGTLHCSAVYALHRAGVRIPAQAKLILIVVGDECGEEGERLGRAFTESGYRVDAMALLVNVAATRGTTVRRCAEALKAPFSEVSIAQFDDPYQVPRVLRALLDAPRTGAARFGLVERVMATPLLSLAPAPARAAAQPTA